MPGVRPSELTPEALITPCTGSPSANALLRGFRNSAAAPSPLAYPSALESHIRQWPVGDSMCSLDSLINMSGLRMRQDPATTAMSAQPVRRS